MEINIRQCKICKGKKQRIYDGKYPNNRDKKWRDETGLLWVGNICGECNQDRAKGVMRKVRSNEKHS
jgi:hypothetical protein